MSFGGLGLGRVVRVVFGAALLAVAASCVPSPTPATIKPMIAAGEDHTCALLASGTVECWGSNGNGELGNGTKVNSSTPVAVTGVKGATKIATGGGHTCALLAGGTVDCWGVNAQGELGNGSTTDSSTPVPVTGVKGATQIIGGLYHTCALLAGGTVKCWGWNDADQLGDGTSVTQSLTPVAVVGVSGATQLVAGGDHTCVLLAGGATKCWGLNSSGELGDGTTTNSSIPVSVAGVSGATKIAPGDHVTCAVLKGGTAECWGGNTFGQLGNGTTTSSTSPVTVTGLTGVAQLAGGSFHTCALLAGETVDCWGLDSFGQLGNGVITGNTPGAVTPVAVSGLSGATQISAGPGGYFTCALLTGGTVDCWGDNQFGQLGNGTNTTSSTPVQVIGLG